MTQQPDIVIWMLTGLSGVLLAGLWWSIKVWINGINDRMDEIMVQLNIISKQNIGFEKDIMRLDKAIDMQDLRLRDQGISIRDLENQRARCITCREK